MNDQIEPSVGEDAEICHVALDGLDHEPIPVGDEPILGELGGAVVEDRDIGSSSGEDRSLLSPAARQAEHIQPDEGWEPLRGDRLCRRQDDRPVAVASTCDRFTG